MLLAGLTAEEPLSTEPLSIYSKLSTTFSFLRKAEVNRVCSPHPLTLQA